MFKIQTEDFVSSKSLSLTSSVAHSFLEFGMTMQKSGLSIT